MREINEMVSKRVETFLLTTSLPPRSSDLRQVEWSDISHAEPTPIGKGTFSNVYKVSLDSETLALKCLDGNLAKSPRVLKTGAVDLALEAKMLERLDHPNIITIRAEKGGDIATSLCDFKTPYFILVDYLHDTLERRLRPTAPKSSRISRLKNQANLFRRKSHNKLLDRVEQCAIGIVRGMEYLHSKKIIFRDLKPNNIGFDLTGQVKIFDFGVARDMAQVRSTNKNLGFAGTPRYMAPEVGAGKDYDLSADVYSFGVLLWEICTLQQPYSKITTMKQYHENIVQCNMRPKLSKVALPELRDLISDCWGADPSSRPSFKEINKRLTAICAVTTGDEHRRRTVMTPWKQISRWSFKLDKVDETSSTTHNDSISTLRLNQSGPFALKVT